MNKETEEKLVELYRQGMKVTEIGNSLGISEITVYRKLRKNNIQTKLRQWGSDPVIRDDIIN